MVRHDAYSFWDHWRQCWDPWGSMNRAINFKPGTDTRLGSGKMPIHFGVTGVNFGDGHNMPRLAVV